MFIKQIYTISNSLSAVGQSQFPIAMSGMSKAQLVDAMDKALEAMMTLMEVANKKKLEDFGFAIFIL